MFPPTIRETPDVQAPLSIPVLGRASGSRPLAAEPFLTNILKSLNLNNKSILRSFPPESRDWAEQALDGLSSAGVRVEVAVLAAPLGGYFSPDSKSIVLSTRLSRSELFSVFLHEYCHFLQWTRSTAAWSAEMEWGMRRGLPDISATGFVEAWVNGELGAASRRRIASAIGTLVAMEAEADELAMAIATRDGLPVDLEAYGAAANAYLAFHYLLLEGADWSLFGLFFDVARSLLPSDVRSRDYGRSGAPGRRLLPAVAAGLALVGLRRAA